MWFFSSVYNFYFNGLMEPTCLKIIYIRVCVCNTCGFHHFKMLKYVNSAIKMSVYHQIQIYL